jgi:hypothetical protein
VEGVVVRVVVNVVARVVDFQVLRKERYVSGF